MSKQESTAINQLIDIARSGKRVADDEAHIDLFRPRPTMTPGLPPAPAVRTRTASGTQNELPAIPAAPPRPAPTATLMGAPAPAKPGANAFDIGQLSTPGMAIPASMRSTRAGLPPPPARPATQPPPFATRSRAEGTPAPELVRPPTPLSAPVLTPAAIAVAEQHAPETLPPESLQLNDTSSLVEKHAPETLDGTPLPQQLPPLPPATLAPPPPRPPMNAVATHPTVSMYPGQGSPVQPPGVPPEHLDGVDVVTDNTGEQGWFDPTSNVNKQDMFEQPAAAVASMPMPGTFEQQPDWGTMQIGRNIRSTTPIYKRKWFVPAAIGTAVLLMFVIGAAAFSGESPRHDAKAKTVAAKDSKDTKTAPAAATADRKDAPAPSTAAVAQNAAAPASETPATPSAPSAGNAAVAAAAPAAANSAATPSNFVDVRFDSNPPGASVMLVDGGKTSFLGTAPVNASVDPTKRYDVVYTLAGHPTQVQHFDASATHHITASLGGRGAQATPHVAAAAPVATPAPAPAPAVASTPRPHPQQHAAVPAPRVAQAAASDDEGDDAAPSGPGTLMVASHPSCEILVDGRDTGKTTPQKAISLPSGLHKVRLLNKDANIDKTVTVSITAGVATKVLQNFAQ